MKVLLVHLIRAFEFELAVNPEDIVCMEQSVLSCDMVIHLLIHLQSCHSSICAV